MSKRFVTYRTEDAKAGLVNVDENGVMKKPTSSIPVVTDEDNGKFMRVVDGKWQPVSIPIAEEEAF